MIGHYSALEIVLFFAIVAAALIVDLFAHRQDKPIPARSAALWSAGWIALSLAFAVYIGITHGWGDSSLFVTAYLLEKSLSVDNLFVIMAVFASFSVPDAFQHRVLYYGILGALVLRLFFISAGTAMIQVFGPYALAAFALFVLWSAWKMWTAMNKKDEEEIVDYSNHWSVRWTRRIIPVHPRLDGHNFFTRQNGRHFATPLLLCLIAVEIADIMFAFDSVPAVLTVTQEPFLVYTSNIFAILGLRSLYFLLSAAVRYLKHLEKAIIGILVFIGLKMLLDVTGVIGHLHPALNLAVVGLLLALGVMASILDKRDEPALPEKTAGQGREAESEQAKKTDRQ